jgi:hypothetical protein
VVQSQPRQRVPETLSQKHPIQKGLAEWLKVKSLSLSLNTTITTKKHQIPLPLPRQALRFWQQALG